jgi:aldehyde dehydrogenase (NAD+)
VPAAAMAVFANAGQICSAGTRLFVQREIHDEFMARLAEHTHHPVGDPLDPATQIGPVVSGPQMEKILGFIEGAGQEGARRWWAARAWAARGWTRAFHRATIFTGVTDEMTIAREEIFGPCSAPLPSIPRKRC